MMRVLGLVVVVLVAAGCGNDRDQGAQAPAGSVDGWSERMRQAHSVRFDVAFTSDEPQVRPWRRTGEMSPLSSGMWQVGTPKPVQRMVESYRAYRTGQVVESEVVERFSREFYLRDTRVTVPQGKRWVKLELNTDALWMPNVERHASMTLNALHPGSLFVDLDRRTLVVSPGSEERADGARVWRYELTASANVESNPNTARGKRVEATVWVNDDGLPVRVEQRSISESGYRNTKVTRYSGWDATPPVEVPPAAEVAEPGTATWTER